MKIRLVLLVLCVFIASVFAQKRPVPLTESHYRVIGIDKIVKDPKTGARKPAHADGMLGFAVLAYSKDGQHCLVEYVAAKYTDHDDFRASASSNSDPHIKVFDKALVKREVWEPILKAAGFQDVDFSKTKLVIP